jgi:type IV secretion system protein VirD4
MSGRELLTPDEVRGLDNRYAILFIRGVKPVMDLKYDLMRHPAIRYTVDGGGPPYIHHQEKPQLKFQGEPLFAPEFKLSEEEKENAEYAEIKAERTEKHPAEPAENRAPR